MDKFEVNRKYFGNNSFREGQEQLIDGIMACRDSLGIMPTGGGKSLCYQIPALLLPGLTLVVSPLISLMKDQVTALSRAGVPAAFLNSSMDNEEYRSVTNGIFRSAYKLVYIAPERLENEGFVRMMREREISLVAVDEAHCISQWGQDFRPSYLKINDFIAALPKRPVVAAFTATATEEVKEDIVRLLELRNPQILVSGFDRPNLFFDVQRPARKITNLVSLVKERRGKSGIVYCSTRNNVENVCDKLISEGIAATKYHAGLTDDERRQNQDDFQFDRKTVMVATNAFGMGIDKSNVGYVIHYNMPKSLEAYYQEAGRAGRDGESADCIMLYSPGDVNTAKYLIEHGGENEQLSPEERDIVRRQDYKRLEVISGYCKTQGCFRKYILNYFGESSPGQCGNCGNCCCGQTMQDITIPAQKIMSCVKRIKDKLGYHVGSSLVIAVLRGSKNKRVIELGLDKLSTYGLMSELSRQTVQSYIDGLENQGFLNIEPKYSTLRLTELSGNVLFKGERVELPVKALPVKAEKESKPEPKPAASQEIPDVDSELFDYLRSVRAKIAKEEEVPAYIVFSNAALQDMVRRCPRTMLEFLEVNGVGEVKAARYGKIFLEAIDSYLGDDIN